MDEIALARHGESVAAAQGLVGGDSPLTERGREQARSLGARLRRRAIDICITSGARRARETATFALEGRQIPIAMDEDLGDIGFGVFDGRPLSEYRAWVETHHPDEAPPGGESRVESLRRVLRAFRALVERRERFILVIAHGLTLQTVLDPTPRPIVADVPYGSAVFLRAVEFEHAVERLEKWCSAQAW